MSKTLAALNSELDDVSDRMTAILDTEKRSAEDDKELDGLVSRSEALKAQVTREEKLQAKLAELRSARGASSPAAGTENRSQISPLPYTGRKLRAIQGPDAEERAYRCGQWYLANLFGRPEARKWCDQHLDQRAIPGQQEGDFALGGALVQPQVLAEVLKLVEEYGVYPSVVRNIPMKSSVLTIPRRVDGLKAYYIDEGEPFKESEAKWDRVTLTARKVGVINRLTTEVMEDSIVSIGDLITEEIGRAFAEKVDMDGFLGDGGPDSGLQTGIVTHFESGNYDASVVTAPAGEDGLESISLDTMNAVVGQLPMYARGRAQWFMSPVAYAAVCQRLMLAAGGARPGDIAGGQPLSFLGFPVKLVLVMDSQLGSDPGKIKILFGDMTLSSAMGLRRAMTMKVSDQRHIELDQILMLASTRWALENHSLGSDKKKGPVIALKTGT